MTDKCPADTYLGLLAKGNQAVSKEYPIFKIKEKFKEE